MAEARQHDEWSRTSSVMALVANTQRNPKKTRPFRPSDFDPFARAADKRTQIIPAPVSVLKDVFIRNQKQQGGTRED
ncbi:MAG: hypothetical protein ACIAS6_03625 [Phycisphaerales bacterium JB060]